MINYANGKIYCIRNRADGDKAVYVGSSAQTLSERMAQHRKGILKTPHLKLYQLMGQVGVEHFHIELVVDFPCERREQLLAEEGRHIRILNTIDGGCNSKMAGRGPVESMRAFNEEHRDEIKVYRREHYVENRDEIKARSRAYYVAHREERLAKDALYNAAHREERKAKNHAYDESHRAERRAYMDGYRERKRAAAALAQQNPEPVV